MNRGEATPAPIYNPQFYYQNANPTPPPPAFPQPPPIPPNPQYPYHYHGPPPPYNCNYGTPPNQAYFSMPYSQLPPSLPPRTQDGALPRNQSAPFPPPLSRPPVPQSYFNPNFPAPPHMVPIVSSDPAMPQNSKKKKSKSKKERPKSTYSLIPLQINHRHKLKPRPFKVPHTCSICLKFISGFGIQGYYCVDQDCAFRAHKGCAKKEAERGMMDFVESSPLSLPTQGQRPAQNNINNNNNNNPNPENHQHTFQPTSFFNVHSICFYCHTSNPPPPFHCTFPLCKTTAHKECLDAHYQREMNPHRHQIQERQSNPNSKLQAGSYLVKLSDITRGEKIGSGACGEVYAGKLFGAEVAVKMLSINQDQFQQVLGSFYHELDIMMKLHHPNIVLLMGACTEANHMIIVTELTHHGSLHDVLHQKKMPLLNWQIRLQLAEQCALGMNWLHMQRPQILHRDLKTANILIDKNLVAKICDFGISKVFERLDHEGGFFGSPIYSAPECLLQQPYDYKADCFSFSYILWELITNQIPYEGMFQSFQDLIETIVVRKHRASIPHSCPLLIADLTVRCWAPLPQERPSFQWMLDSGVFRNPQVLAQDPLSTQNIQQAQHPLARSTDDDLCG